jgi:hypothetical protein
MLLTPAMMAPIPDTGFSSFSPAPILNVHSAPYQFNSILAYKGGLLFKASTTKIRIRNSITTLDQTMEINALVQDARMWNHNLARTNKTLYELQQNNSKMHDPRLHNTLPIEYLDKHQIMLDSKIEQSRTEINMLAYEYKTAITTLLESYNKALPSEQLAITYENKTRNRRFVKLLVPLLKAIRPLTKI